MNSEIYRYKTAYASVAKIDLKGNKVGKRRNRAITWGGGIGKIRIFALWRPMCCRA